MPALILALVLAGCAGNGHFVDPGLRVVDGVEMTTEEACAPGDCGEELRAARVALALPDSVVVTRVLRGDQPTAWLDGKPGSLPVLVSRAGLSQPKIVILELDDGTRRAVQLWCAGYSGHPYSCTAQ